MSLPNRFDQLRPAPRPVLTAPNLKPARDYSAGIAQPEAVRAAMLSGFRHGKARGETTHWTEWDQHFTWKPGEVNGWTGYNNCFVGSTPVQTEMGLISIDTVVAGMKVLSYNHDKGGYEYRKVLNTICTKDLLSTQSILTFVLTTGESISCTENHEFYDGSDYVSARVLAQRALAGNRGNQQPVLYLDLRPVADRGVEGNGPDAGNEAITRFQRVPAHHDNSTRPDGHHEAAPLGGDGLLAQPVELGTGKSQKHGSGRQPGGKPGMGHGHAERAARVQNVRSDNAGHESSKFQANGSAGIGNASQVRAASIQRPTAGKRVLNLSARSQKNIAAQTLETYLIAQVIERRGHRPVYDLTVQGNHNYCVGEGRYLVHNCGKTEALLQLMLTKSVRDDWKWAMWCPENDPVDEIYDSLAHALAGQSPDPDWRNQMSEQAYENCMDFLFAHFFVIDPPEAPTLECLFDYTRYVVETHECRGVLWDPWNRIAHAKAGRRDDEYLQDVLPQVVAFAKQHKQCFNLTMHPTKPVKSLPRPGVEPTWNCPDQFDLAGGAMWGNMLHNVMAVHRPFYLQNKANTTVEWHSHKIKKQKLVGRPGFVTLDFDFSRNRYLLNGSTPLEPYASHIVSPESFQQPAAPVRSPLPYERLPLPASDFDQPAPWADPAPMRIAATARPGSPLGVAGVKFGPMTIE